MPHTRPRLALFCQQATVLAAVTAVGLSAAGVVRLDVVPPSGDPAAEVPGGVQDASLVSAAPVEPTVRSVPLGGAAAAGSRMPRAAGGAARDGGGERPVRVVSTAEKAPGYATVGVTWDAGQTVTEETVQVAVRTRVAGSWSPWQEMHFYPDHEPEPEEVTDPARGGTDAVIVGDVDEVRVRVVSEGRTPDGLRLELIDPGDEDATVREEPAIDTGSSGEPEGDATLSSAEPDPLVAETAAVSAPKPQIFSRQQWGADESLRDRGSLRYGQIQGGFVHHTVNANSYSREQVPSLLRGIYAYHTRSRGWSDVGYNFLVDRFGRIWEGRAGGVNRPVVGAHTLGYNEHSFAMSAIGNFETVQPPQAMLDAYAQLFAWKLSLHGVRADDPSVRIGSRNFAAISGHRDAGSTACPGRYLYAKLGGIRAAAAALQKKKQPEPEPPRVVAREHNSDISGRKWPDFVARDRQSGRATVVRTGGQLAFLEPTKAAEGLSVDLVTAPGDVDGDGSADLLARSTRTGGGVLYRGAAASGRLSAGRTVGNFAGLDQLAAGGDLNGDGKVDLVGRNRSTGVLRLYPGRGDGSFAKVARLSADWSRYDLTAGVGDLDGDGFADLVARTGSKLFLFPGNGRGALRSPVQIEGDWSGFDLVAGRGDITGDGVPDLVARQRDSGTTFFYPGDGRGGVGTRLGGTQRYAGQRWLALGGQMVGNRAGDLVALDRAGAVRVYRNSGGTNIPKVVDTGIDLSAADLVLSVGDWNGDKNGDFMARRGGEMLFYAGKGNDRFAAPVRAGLGWGQVSHAAVVGDATGDGAPDLVGQLQDGSVRVYPGNGKAGFRQSFPARTSDAGNALAGAGLWYGDGAPTAVMRRAGQLWLYRTNAAGELTTKSQVGTRAGRYDHILGLGNLDGTGKADLLVRQKATGDLWMLRGTGKGFTSARRFVAEGFNRYDLMG